MESDTSCAILDDREEGEIVDDDFEDISDNSIIVPLLSGKSVSPKEHLPAISLSSVSEVDETNTETKIRHRHKVPRRKSLKCKKRRNSHRKSTCSDSDSDSYRKLQKQLQAAIRVDDTEERHTNSLRLRLKGMTKLEESDSSPEKNGNDKCKEKDSSDDGDSELAALRLEALRTAVLNKFMHRKKRKVKEMADNDVLSDGSVRTDNSETNKENNHNTTENCPKKLCVDKSVQIVENNIEMTDNMQNSTPPEDDEDVLRALLLASMSKKITGETGKKNTLPLTNGLKHNQKIVVEKKGPSTVNTVINFRNRLNKNNITIKNLELPKVKPLIINLNDDSDSEDDSVNKTIKRAESQIVTVPKPIDIEIQNSVEQFLKEQRAKVEAQLSPIPKCSDNASNLSLIHEKSCVKLLPKVKQVEYQKLLQKLKNAEKKPRIRRASLKVSGEGKLMSTTPKRIVRPKLPMNKQATVGAKVDPLPDIKNDVRMLHKILKEIQVQKNGRLQIQEKYKVLMPVIKKINETSVERRKCEDEVKGLLEQIAEMKKRLLKSQQDFTAQVSSLIQEKQRIDKSMTLKKPVQDTKACFTSTPVKELAPVVSFNGSFPPGTAPNNKPPLPEKAIEVTVENSVEDAVTEMPLNPGDPNDIDKICYKQRTAFPKYISPLDNVKREVTGDPFSIMCPYDVDGNCRDPECIYKHFFK